MINLRSTNSPTEEKLLLIFFYKIINGHIDSPEILEQFDLICNKSGFRSYRFLNTIIIYVLNTTHSSKSYVHHGPRNRIANSVTSLTNYDLGL